MPEHLSKTQPADITPPLQEGRKAGLSRTRLALAFLVAMTSDVVSYFTELVPPVQWAVDLVTALLLFMILGWQWALLPGFVAEAIPGMAALPVWTLVVAAVVLWGHIK